MNKEEQLLIDLELAFLEDVYEPSERGAGYCATKDARENAKGLLEEYAKQSMDEVQEYLNDNCVNPYKYDDGYLHDIVRMIGLEFIDHREGWQPLPELPREGGKE